jgi:hypothetical protein
MIKMILRNQTLKMRGSKKKMSMLRQKLKIRRSLNWSKTKRKKQILTKKKKKKKARRMEKSQVKTIRLLEKLIQLPKKSKQPKVIEKNQILRQCCKFH